MKFEYWKEINMGYYYKMLLKKSESWKVLEVSPDSIGFCLCPKSWITACSKPCTKAAFLKRYNQTLKKIEKAVAK